MTSRLKKKLGNLGVDAGSARANESFCLIGTPLPPLEKQKDLGEFVPLWKQDVRDEKGRRRLHGAFTGGFSAGYFNTVGSKEGWTPSTFVSSRADRAKKAPAKPEDFMDEEDVQALKDGRTLIHNADEMDIGQGGVKPIDENDDIANVLAHSLTPAPTDSSGARILKKMGWKLGQGIGPRLSWSQRRAQDIAAGVSPGGLPSLDDDEACKHSYAPRDTPVIHTDRKDNSHGLGYRPGMGLNETKGTNGLNISAGFGLGALNEADEDDVDVYDKAIGASGRHAFDITDNADDERISIGQRSGYNRPSTATIPRQTFSNGSMVLAEFSLSDKPVAEDRWFPLAEVPSDWKPDPTRVWRQDPNKENESKFSYDTLQQHYRAGTSADERGKILGETPLPSTPRSVFEFISQKDRERIQKAATGQPIEPPPEPTLFIPPVESHIAQAALTGFQPYRNEPDKQSRYVLYLQYQLDPTSSSAAAPPARLPGQAVDEFNKEMDDYKNSATLFKPMSGAMAGRFTSAAIVEHGPKILEGLHTPSSSSNFLSTAHPEEDAVEVEERELSAKENAAKMGMYGAMTRESTAWMPAKLLCKRFGVKQPEPLVQEQEESAASAPSATPHTDAFVSEAKLAIKATGDDSEDVKPGRRDLANVGLGDDESQGKDILTYERPAMDIFKAIFASDEEESEDEKVEDVEEPMQVVIEPVAVSDEPVDPSTFKPTFVPRSKKSKEKEREKEDKVEKKRKKKDKVLVSFDVDDGGVGLDIQPKVDRPKKKRKKEKRDEDEMWVEKPPLDVKLPGAIPPDLEGDEELAGPARGRKRAVDFM